jgi:hypothetical protein
MIFIGDEGTKIEVKGQDGFDVSGAVEAKIKYVKPDRTTGEWVASIDVENNSVYHVSGPNDFDLAGSWRIQAYVDLGTWKGHSTMESFQVSQLMIPIE